MIYACASMICVCAHYFVCVFVVCVSMVVCVHELRVSMSFLRVVLCLCTRVDGLMIVERFRFFFTAPANHWSAFCILRVRRMVAYG